MSYKDLYLDWLEGIDLDIDPNYKPEPPEDNLTNTYYFEEQDMMEDDELDK